jgi:cbb3-type cytochrome oxidase subunit 3
MQNNLWLYIQNNGSTIATVFFFLFFCSAVYSVFKKGQEKKFDDYAKIPLNDKEKSVDAIINENIKNSKPKNRKWFQLKSKLTKN